MAKPGNKHTEQNILNWSFDETYMAIAMMQMGHDGVNAQRSLADSLAMKVTVSGTNTYLALSAPGTAQATAKWQARKIDTSSGVVITWADGNADFDNVASDLTALTYT